MSHCPRCQTPLPNVDGLARCPACSMRLVADAPAPLQDAATPPFVPSPVTRPTLGAVQAASPRLVLRGQGGNVVEYPLRGAAVIGRSTVATVQVADREVSRRHTSVEPDGDAFVAKDLGSANGTFLNGRRLYAPARLRDGDELMVGTTRFVFRSPAARDSGVLRTSDEKASSVVASIDAGRAFQSADHITDVAQLRRDYERLRIAHEFQQFVRIERDLHALLAMILELAFELIPAECGVILLRDDRTGELVVEAVRHKRNDGARVLISETLLGYVASTKQGVLTSDALDDDRFKSSQSIINLGVRSCMAVPLLAGSEVRGVMFLDSRERVGAFTTKDLEVLSAIAGQATIALENSELIRKIEESAAKRSFLERFLSPGLARRVETGAIELTKGGQLQPLTVLFSDIRGFTSMSEHSPPQETVSMLNEYFELMADCVFAYDGIVDKFIGDAVMALFGAPIQGPDDAERAVRCAMLMQQKTKDFNAMRVASGRAPLQIGIGLHTGEAVVGVIGSTKRLEYTAVGDTVNVASRLCNAADPDCIVLSEACRSSAGIASLPAEPLPPMTLKGRQQPLSTYVIRAR